MPYDWIAPTLAAAYEHREELKSLWKKLSDAIGPKARVSLVGMAGVGKTAVLRAVSGESWPDATSRRIEMGRIQGISEKIELVTVPGQIGQERERFLDQVFTDPPVGIVLFTAYGYASYREDVARQHLVQLHPRLNDIRRLNLQVEVEIFEEVSKRIAASLRREKVNWGKRAPRFLLIVPTKIDLYYDRIMDARSYYSMDGTSNFSRQLKEFHHRVGSQNLRVESVPVSAGDASYAWGEEAADTQFLEQHRGFFQRQFAQAVTELCHAVDGL